MCQCGKKNKQHCHGPLSACISWETNPNGELCVYTHKDVRKYAVSSRKSLGFKGGTLKYNS